MAYLQWQQRIEQGAAAYHHLVYLRKTGADACIICNSLNITIIRHRKAKQRKNLSKLVKTRLTAIHLLADARMHCYTTDGVIVKYRNNSIYLIFIIVSKAHLHRKRQRKPRHNLVKESADLFGIRQYARAAMLGSNATHRATDIPVHLIVSQFVKSQRQRHKALWVTPQYLGYHRHRTYIALGPHIIDLLASITNITRRQRQERADGEVERWRIIAMVCATEQQFRETLHGG